MRLTARVALLSVVLGMLVVPIAFPRKPKEPKAATLADPLIQQAVAATISLPAKVAELVDAQPGVRGCPRLSRRNLWAPTDGQTTEPLVSEVLEVVPGERPTPCGREPCQRRTF